MTEVDFCEANTRRKQISTAIKHLRQLNNGQRFTLEQIDRFLEGLKATTVKRQNKLSHAFSSINDRSSLRSDAVIKWMLDLIHSRFEDRKPITDIEMVDLLQIHHQIHHQMSISSDTLHHTIRNLEAVKSVIGTPMELERVAVDAAEIQA
jgi:hypothetical protein